MASLLLTLFIAGLLTILLPCILPLVPIVLGVSVAGRSKWRPLLLIAGMVVSFVGFTFLLVVVLNQFVAFADYVRLATFYVLLLFGFGFLTHSRPVQFGGAALGALFFWEKGIEATVIAAAAGMIAMEIGGRLATRVQQLGTGLQQSAQQSLGRENPLAAFVIGLTMGLVWVPCAGPALGFALTLVREQPGPVAALALASYALGTAVPLLAVGYGGQWAVRSVRAIAPYTGRIKQVAGVLLILTAVALRFDLFLALQTRYGEFGTALEERLFAEEESGESPSLAQRSSTASTPSIPSTSPMNLPLLPKLSRAPEFTSLDPWHNSKPFTLASLKGKVVLVDFWTYTCINCIRTLPYMRGYWDKFKDTGKFVLLGVHTPEFVFEKSAANVAAAIKSHDLTYPVAQDNDYATWNAFANRYWPAKYLIDADGYIRYTHFGEGAYDETDLAIQSLLAEAGVTVSGEPVEVGESGGRRAATPETYLGARSWPSLGNALTSPTDQALTYEAPASMALHKYYLVGEWQLVDGEYQVLRGGEGEIRMKFLGSEMNLVLGLDEGSKPVAADVFIDGVKTKTITITMHDLYNLYTGGYGEHQMVLKLRGTGVQGYAFTFGAG